MFSVGYYNEREENVSEYYFTFNFEEDCSQMRIRPP